VRTIPEYRIRLILDVSRSKEKGKNPAVLTSLELRGSKRKPHPLLGAVEANKPTIPGSTPVDHCLSGIDSSTSQPHKDDHGTVPSGLTEADQIRYFLQHQ
jgi:hypothetical protein